MHLVLTLLKIDHTTACDSKANHCTEVGTGFTCDQRLVHDRNVEQKCMSVVGDLEVESVVVDRRRTGGDGGL